MTMQYLSDPKALRVYLESNHTKFSFHTVQIGNISAFCFGSFPIFIKQYNPNFKKKYFFLNFPIVSLARRTPVVNHVSTESKREPRLYINIGSLPYSDNGSGIPRVSKELCRQGLLRNDITCVPIYPEPRTGTYRIPLVWLSHKKWFPQSRNLKEMYKDGDEDPVVTVQSGDWLVHTMVNNNEIEFMKSWTNDFRNKGGKVGCVLYDLIPENYPQYYRNRDVLLFHKWLFQISLFDGIFAISEATKRDYLSWCQKQNLNSHAPIEYFHLGANFKISESNHLSTNSIGDPLNASSPYFLMVGTLEPRKGHKQVLDAFDLMWSQGIDAKCVFVGRKGWRVDGLCRRIRSHKEWNRRLIWLDKVSDKDLLIIYKGAKVVIVASETEGFGLSVVEAMYHQKPLVLRDIPVFREIAGQDAFYFKGNSSEALSDALLKALRSRIIPQKKHPITWSESFDQFINIVKKLTS